MKGTILSNRYLLAEEVGTGGMGSVYLATDLRTGAQVAVKVPHSFLARDAEYLERLRREAQIAASLYSPRVVRVMDLDNHEGLPFLVMEYVPGETLAELLKAHGRFTLPETLTIGLEVARALDAAHQKGIIHRDLKPQNIKLVEGEVKVLDFGIAKAEGYSGLTSASIFIGTPEYCGPERAEGFGDIRADIYSIGIILYEMYEGQLPYKGATPIVVMRKHESEPVPRFSGGVPDSAQRLLQKALAKNPDDRYQTPRAMAQDLAIAIQDAREFSPTLPTSGEPPVVPIPSTPFTGAEARLGRDSASAPAAPPPPTPAPVARTIAPATVVEPARAMPTVAEPHAGPNGALAATAAPAAVPVVAPAAVAARPIPAEPRAAAPVPLMGQAPPRMSAPPVAAPPAPAKKGGPPWALIGGGLAVLAAAGIVAALFTSGGGGGTPVAPTVEAGVAQATVIATAVPSAVPPASPTPAPTAAPAAVTNLLTFRSGDDFLANQPAGEIAAGTPVLPCFGFSGAGAGTSLTVAITGPNGAASQVAASQPFTPTSANDVRCEQMPNTGSLAPGRYVATVSDRGQERARAEFTVAQPPTPEPAPIATPEPPPPPPAPAPTAAPAPAPVRTATPAPAPAPVRTAAPAPAPAPVQPAPQPVRTAAPAPAPQPPAPTPAPAAPTIPPPRQTLVPGGG